MKRINEIRNQFLNSLTHKVAVPFLMAFRKNTAFNYTMEDLEKFEEGTLGKDLSIYLKAKQLGLMKNYERHDCKHIIFEYEMDLYGEAAMQFYFLGNRRYTIPVLLSVLAYLVVTPENWKKYKEEYKKGSKRISMRELDKFTHNELIIMRTEELKNKFLCYERS